MIQGLPADNVCLTMNFQPEAIPAIREDALGISLDDKKGLRLFHEKKQVVFLWHGPCVNGMLQCLMIMAAPVALGKRKQRMNTRMEHR